MLPGPDAEVAIRISMYFQKTFYSVLAPEHNIGYEMLAKAVKLKKAFR